METFHQILSSSASTHSSHFSGRNTINFFICSAFEDFEIERKILSSKIFPKLRDECFANYGVEINLLDLKLGIDARHEVSETFNETFTEYLDRHGICDQNNCPIFLFGQRYGRPIIPRRIPLGLFELFKKTLRRYKNRFSIDTTILEQYYNLDHNILEPMMILAEAVDIVPQINSKVSTLVEEGLQQWTEIIFQLSDLLKSLCNICLQNESLDLLTVQNLLKFDLDASVSKTLRKSLDSNFFPIIFCREIIDINNFIVISNETKDEKRKGMIQKLIDVVYNSEQDLQIEVNNQGLLDQLLESCVEIYDNIEPPFKVLWRDDTGISEEYHIQYIEEMIAFFNMKIDEAVNERVEFLLTELSSNLLKCYDIICDANIQVERLAKLCCGFEDIVSALLAYVNDEFENIPMLLFGPRNSGKSIVLSKTVYELQQIRCNSLKAHVIIRFVNAQFSLEDILMSIFYQMSAIALNRDLFQTIVTNSNEIDRSIPKDLEGILLSFQYATSEKFIIILHDYEKCFSFDPNFNIEQILPKVLPSNVKLIVTTTGNWGDRKLDLLNLSVPEFSVTEYNSFVQTQLYSLGKVLSATQSEQVLQPYLKQIKGIFDAALTRDLLKRYRSFDVVDHQKFESDTFDVLTETLKMVSERYGEILVKHVICLLHCSRGGLTTQEIVDLLSLDGEVVQEMSTVNPSSLIRHNETLKFPLSLWLLIRHDLSAVLIEKMRDGYVLLDLSDKSIVESLQTFHRDINLGYFHTLLSEYYLGLWYGVKKPFFNQSKVEHFYNCLPKQQQQMFSKKGKMIFYNYRKLRQLVHHLVEAKMNDKLLEEVIFNFDWLYYKIKALDIAELLEDFKCASNGSKEIILLEESFRNSAMIIDKDLDSLAGELIGQLLPYVPYYPNLRFLIENCDTVAPKHNAFIPIYANDKLPGSPLASTISCPAAIESVEIVKNQVTQNDELLLKVKGDCHIYFYDLILGVIVSNTLVSHGIVFLGSNTDIIFILESKFQQVIKVHKRTTGDLLGQIIPMNWVVPRPFENKQDYKITKIDIGKTKAALLVTNEVTYLFIVNLQTFEPILAFNPGVKLQMLKLGNDESKVFSHHGEKLISFEIATNKPNSAVELQGNPIQMIFSMAKFNKAFIICKEQKGVVVLELDKHGSVNKCYKISFDNCLNNDDYVKEVSCSQLGNTYLLIRSDHSVLLYDWKREKVLCHVTRPVQLPIYFKLPNQLENQPASLQFNAAKLILADRVLACSLFRDVILCAVSDNKVLTTLHAPVGGIVSEIFVTDDFLIGRVNQNDDSAEIMIWRTETSSLFSKIETLQDRLTKSVTEIHCGPSIAIATCDNSDEMGVIEISTGTLVDLYSHASKVLRCCLSVCGKFALVTVDNNQNSNILWSLESRRIIFEFGNSLNTSFLVQLKSVSGFLCICDYSISIDNPLVMINEINCSDTHEGSSYSMSKLNVDKLGFVCEKPCVLNDDKILVVLSNNYQKQNDSVSTECTITIWSRENNFAETGISKVLGIRELSEQIGHNLTKILSMNSMTKKETNVVVLCEFADISSGSLILDCVTSTVLQFVDLIKSFPKMLNVKSVHLSQSGNYLFVHDTLCVIDLNTSQLIGNIPLDPVAPKYNFQCFALSDTILVLSQIYKLTAWRIPEFTKIGQVELKDEITYISKCHDDFTLLVGCRDGSVVSYAIVDVFSPNSHLSKIRVVRNFRPMSKSPTIQLESSDVPNNVSTKLSLEFDIKPAQRPMSDPTFSLERRGFSPLF